MNLNLVFLHQCNKSDIEMDQFNKKVVKVDEDGYVYIVMPVRQ